MHHSQKHLVITFSESEAAHVCGLSAAKELTPVVWTNLSITSTRKLHKALYHRFNIEVHVSTARPYVFAIVIRRGKKNRASVAALKTQIEKYLRKKHLKAKVIKAKKASKAPC